MILWFFLKLICVALRCELCRWQQIVAASEGRSHQSSLILEAIIGLDRDTLAEPPCRLYSLSLTAVLSGLYLPLGKALASSCPPLSTGV